LSHRSQLCGIIALCWLGRHQIDQTFDTSTPVISSTCVGTDRAVPSWCVAIEQPLTLEYNMSTEYKKVEWQTVLVIGPLSVLQSPNSGNLKFSLKLETGRSEESMPYGVTPRMLPFIAQITPEQHFELQAKADEYRGHRKAAKEVEKLQAKIEAERTKARTEAAKALKALGMSDEVIIKTLADMSKAV
jgi:hypothetical protein